MTSTKKIKNPSTSQTSQHLVAANVWSCPAAHLNVHVESESVYHFIPLFLFTQSSAMSLYRGLIHPSCPVMLFVRTGLMAFGLEGQHVWDEVPTRQMSLLVLSLAHFCEFYCMRMAVLGLIVSLGSTPVLLCVRAQTALIKLLKCCL